MWIYLLLLFIFESLSSSEINQAPAKVTIMLQMSRLSHDRMKDTARLKLCVDKRNERCFWKLNEELLWDGEQYKDKSFTFFIDNMSTNITLDVTIENGSKKMNFPRKTISLLTFNSRDSFSIYSMNLESFITIIIEHECENGYYPPRQCNKVCYPIPGESQCDGFGNKLCKGGLLYNAEIDRCISNNCMKSNNLCRNGHCVNSGATLKCICSEIYFGRYCQYRNPCYKNLCLNGGKCIANENAKTFTCSCPEHYTGNRCDSMVTKKCACPKHMKCNYSKDGLLESCTAETSTGGKENAHISSPEIQDNNNLRSGGLGSKKYNEWNQINLTTLLIAAVGCLIVIICVTVSLYVYCRSRENKIKRKMKRDYRTDNSPSTLYTDFTPKLNETSFKRSPSLDDNIIYITGSHQILPNPFHMGSSTGYSLNSNSYQDNPPSSFRNFPLQGPFLYQQEYPITPLILQHSYTKNNTSSMSTMSTSSMPPALPPRPENVEAEPLHPLPTNE